MGSYLARFIFLSWLFLKFYPILSYENHYLNYFYELATLAEQKKLAEDPYWLRLGHYKKTIWGGYKSEADGPLFFMSADGRTNPSAELRATLYGFFFGDFLRPDAQHPQCRFPERFHWLREQLSLDLKRLPLVSCELYDGWRQYLQIESVSFIFASYYINNPSSMFGHTLLKLNRKGTAKDRELIDFGLNYAANTNTDNPILYALWGIFGGFPGNYTLFPYYFKVREYNDLESRDLWEYPLNLTEEEIERLLRHTWELGSTWFDYYYFNENCSYQLLTLLEVVRPQLHLSDAYFYVVQPIDTVKAIVKTPGLILGEPNYRPSQFNKYLAYFNLLSAEEQREFFLGQKKKILPRKALPPISRATIIDTHLEYHNFRFFGQEVISPEEKKFLAELLAERALLGHFAELRTVAVVPPDLPTSGHESSTWRFSYLTGSLGRGVALLFRPALRELIDSPLGYSPFAQVIMFDFAIRFYPQVRALPYVDFITFFDVTSLALLHPSHLRPSWALRVGLQSLHLENMTFVPHDKMTFYAEGGGGFTLPLLARLSWFNLLQLRLELSPVFFYGFRLAPVFTSGLLWRLFRTVSWLSRFDGRYYLFTGDWPVLLWHNGFNWGISQAWALEVTATVTLLDPLKQAQLWQELVFAVKYYR